MAEPKENTAAKQQEVIKYIEIAKKGNEKPPRFDVWQSAPKSEWEYVEIPKEDLHSYVYPSIMINQDKFESGAKYFVPPLLAHELRRVMKRFETECLALLQPKKRQAALEQAGRNGTRVGQVGAIPLSTPGMAEAMPGGD